MRGSTESAKTRKNPFARLRTGVGGRTNPGRAELAVLVAAAWMALLLSAPPASASSLPAPTLSITAETCTALLEWTHDNPNDLNIYNYQHRVRGDGESSWDGWNNVDGGASSARSVLVRSYRDAGHHEYQVRAVAITPSEVSLRVTQAIREPPI